MRRERGRKWDIRIDQLIVVFFLINRAPGMVRGVESVHRNWKVMPLGDKREKKDEKLTVSRARVGAQSVGRRQGQSKSNKFRDHVV